MKSALDGKWRRRLRRIGTVLLGLFLTAAGAVLVADVWHQWQLNSAVKDVRDVVERREGSRGAPFWFARRTTGTNGWDHLIFIGQAEAEHLAAGSPWSNTGDLPYAKLLQRLDELRDYEADRWQELEPEDAPEGWKPSAKPTAAQLQALLVDTHILAQVMRLAAAADAFWLYPVYSDREPFVGSFSATLLFGAFRGRIQALRELSRFAEAESELVAACVTVSKWRVPWNFLDAWMATAVLRSFFEVATDMFGLGQLSATAARTLAELDLKPDELLADCVLADFVWISHEAMQDRNLLRRARWFEWLSRDQSEVSDYYGGIPAYGWRAQQCRDMRVSLLTTLKTIDYIWKDKPLAAWPESPTNEVNYYGVAPESLPLHYNSFRRSCLPWLELRLRVLGGAGGPLTYHREEVRKIVESAGFAEFTWDEDTLILYPAATVKGQFPGGDLSEHIRDYGRKVTPAPTQPKTD